MKKLDGSILPPCSRVLLKKIKRTHLVAKRRLSSTQGTQSTISALESGWKEENGCYRLHWFDGETSPALSDVICNEVDYSQESREEGNNDLYDY